MEDGIQDILRNYDEMQAVVDAVSMGMSVSELHGYQAGLGCLGLKLDAMDWWGLLQMDYPAGANTEVDTEDQELLYSSFLDVLSGLESGDFAFQLLLPDDQDSLVARVSALSDWCAGFFSGIQRGITLAEPDVSDILQNNEIIMELLRDIEAIRQADKFELGEPEDFEATEQDYAEISEYVRMAALNIFLEIGVATTESDTHSEQMVQSEQIEDMVSERLDTPQKPKYH